MAVGWGVGEAVGIQVERRVGVTREVWVANKSLGEVVPAHPVNISAVITNKIE